MALAAACSSAKKEHQETAPPQLAESGPTILNPRVTPQLIELNRNFQSPQPVVIVADVKDFQHKVDSVNLRFKDVPLEIPMTPAGGTLWRAELTPEQIQMLAVGGRTINYQAEIAAKSDNGDSSVSSQPVIVAIHAPDITQPQAGAG